ncbi:DUF6171 family protein [Acetatifactor muris]|nr:DUF6171 family protein [Acetatifactor muris]
MQEPYFGKAAERVMEQESGNLRLCKKCLLRDMEGQEEYFRSLREYIENLDEDRKVSASVYEERLTVCRQCEMLLEGMCRSCGCYVELRAAVAKNSCPREYWMKMEQGGSKAACQE